MVAVTTNPITVMENYLYRIVFRLYSSRHKAVQQCRDAMKHSVDNPFRYIAEVRLYTRTHNRLSAFIMVSERLSIP